MPISAVKNLPSDVRVNGSPVLYTTPDLTSLVPNNNEPVTLSFSAPTKALKISNINIGDVISSDQTIQVRRLLDAAIV